MANTIRSMKEVAKWPGVKHVGITTIRRFKSPWLVNRICLTVSNAPLRLLRLAAPTAAVESLAMAWKRTKLSTVVPIVRRKKAQLKYEIVPDRAYEELDYESKSDPDAI